jgi:hypothetical protein
MVEDVAICTPLCDLFKHLIPLGVPIRNALVCKSSTPLKHDLKSLVVVSVLLKDIPHIRPVDEAKMMIFAKGD